MPAIELFFDSSALIAGVISSQGAARALLLLSEDGKIHITVSEQVLVELERSLARKAPLTLPFAREMILRANLTILPDPPLAEIKPRLDWIADSSDVPILVSAFLAHTGYLVTLNTRHFMEDPNVAQKSGLRIGTPGDALAWVRYNLMEQP